MAKTKKIASERKLQYLARILLVIIGVLIFSYTLISKEHRCNGQLIHTKQNKLCAKVSDDGYERASGLSGVKKLDIDEVMLFIFDSTDRHGIWMKDMLIPIDIVWLNESKQIVWIEKNVQPNSYPKVYYPESPSKYVIEMPDGLSSELNLTVDYQFSW